MLSTAGTCYALILYYVHRARVRCASGLFSFLLVSSCLQAAQSLPSLTHRPQQPAAAAAVTRQLESPVSASALDVTQRHTPLDVTQRHTPLDIILPAAVVLRAMTAMLLLNASPFLSEWSCSSWLAGRSRRWCGTAWCWSSWTDEWTGDGSCVMYGQLSVLLGLRRIFRGAVHM